MRELRFTSPILDRLQVVSRVILSDCSDGTLVEVALLPKGGTDRHLGRITVHGGVDVGDPATDDQGRGLIKVVRWPGGHVDADVLYDRRSGE